MVALLATVAFQGFGPVDPSVVDLLVARTEWSDSYPTFARSFVDYGDDASALRLLDRWTPPRNAELYGWHKRDRNARGMVNAISRPYEPLPLPVLELMYHQDEDHIKKAVAHVRAADKSRECLVLGGKWLRESLHLLPTDTQLVDLCVVLSNSEYKPLAVKIFGRYLAAEYAGNTEVAKYLGYIAGDRAELAIYFPSGLDVISIDELLMYASLLENGRYDDAALSAVLSGDRWAAKYHRGNFGSTHLFAVLDRLERTGRRRDVVQVVDRYIDAIDDWIIADPLFGRSSWAPLLVQIGRTAPLSAAARSIWASAKPVYEEQVSSTPTAVNSSPIETAAVLFALSGDLSMAKEALALMRRAPASAPSTTMAHLESQRLTLMGRYVEAFEVWIPECRYYMGKLVDTGREAIRHSVDVKDKRRIARRIVTEMLSTGVFHDWTEFDEALLSLGLKGELRSVLDAACSDPYQNKREYDDAFRCYIALGDDAAARRFAFPHEVRAAWLLDVLSEWDELLHGPKTKLLNVDGRNVFDEGVKGFSEIVPKHPFWVGNFLFLLEYVPLSKPLKDRAIVELRVCLSLLSDDLAKEMSLDLLKDMFALGSGPLPMLSTQRDVASAISDRLRIGSGPACSASRAVSRPREASHPGPPGQFDYVRISSATGPGAT